jgi:hypothetical protein
MAGIIITTTMAIAEKMVIRLFIFPLNIRIQLSSEYTNRQ